MNLRRFTMTNPTAVFSIIAHEALGHKSSDGENNGDAHQADVHRTSQRSRRRFGVSENTFSYHQILF